MLLAGLKPIVTDKIVRNCDPGSQLPPRPSQVPPLNLASVMPSGNNNGHTKPQVGSQNSPAFANALSVQRRDLFEDYDQCPPQVSDYLSFGNLQNDEMAWENLELDVLDKPVRQRSPGDDAVCLSSCIDCDGHIN